MKITISFSNEEKNIASNMVMGIGEVSELDDKDLCFVGKFGKFSYDHNKNVMEYDLKTDFLKATSNLIIDYVNLIKSFMKTYMTYLESWVSDIEEVSDTTEQQEEINE